MPGWTRGCLHTAACSGPPRWALWAFRVGSAYNWHGTYVEFVYPYHRCLEVAENVQQTSARGDGYDRQTHDGAGEQVCHLNMPVAHAIGWRRGQKSPHGSIAVISVYLIENGRVAHARASPEVVLKLLIRLIRFSRYLLQASSLYGPLSSQRTSREQVLVRSRQPTVILYQQAAAGRSKSVRTHFSEGFA